MLCSFYQSDKHITVFVVIFCTMFIQVNICNPRLTQMTEEYNLFIYLSLSLSHTHTHTHITRRACFVCQHVVLKKSHRLVACWIDWLIDTAHVKVSYIPTPHIINHFRYSQLINNIFILGEYIMGSLGADLSDFVPYQSQSFNTLTCRKIIMMG